MQIKIFTVVFLFLNEARNWIALTDMDGYEHRFSLSLRDASQKEYRDTQIIRYRIKKSIAVPNLTNRPVLYVVSGRALVEDTQKQYNLFDSVIDEFNSAAVVYVEQRYFGRSMPENGITKFSDLRFLTVDNIIADNVKLIKDLSKELNTKNFLVVGGGYGGLVASYLSYRFATDARLSGFKVLAWSSSPPIKFLKQQSDFSGSDLQMLGQQYKALLVQNGCDSTNDIPKLKMLFDAIKSKRTREQIDFLNKLFLYPKPQAADKTISDDLKRLCVFIRNKMIELAFDNPSYELDLTGSRIINPKLKQLCDIIKKINTISSVDTTKVNAILNIFDKSEFISWKIVNNGVFNQRMAAAAYQDCSELQIVYCPASNSDTSDPFTGSQWNTEDTYSCKNLNEYKQFLKSECQGIFNDTNLDPEIGVLNPNRFPRTIKKNVIVTLNQQSIFYKSYKKLLADKDESKFAFTFELSGSNGWELQAPRECDTEHVRDVRYLILRAFGCFAGFLNSSSTDCQTVFNDDANGKTYSDTPSNVSLCAPEINEKLKKFPFGHNNVTFIRPNTSHDTTKAISTKMTTSPTLTEETTTKSSGSIVFLSFVLISSLFTWLFIFSAL